MPKTVVLYHADCADGFCAAWIAQRELRGIECETVCLPVKHGQPPPELPEGTQLLFVLDFSYPLETMQSLWQQVGDMVVLDHHRTAQEPLAELVEWMLAQGINPMKLDVRFDLERSGAAIAWDYFHLYAPRPQLVNYVQDRDLWRWALPDSKAVNAAIRSYPFEWDHWDWLKLQCEQEESRGVLVWEGTALLRGQAQQVQAHVRNATIQEVGGHRVPVVNATMLMSEIGEALCEAYPEAPFAATYSFRNDGCKVWSLSSRGGFDVGALAKTLSPHGGGHPSAAGFEEPPLTPGDLMRIALIQEAIRTPERDEPAQTEAANLAAP